jgi:hypothetical protein
MSEILVIVRKMSGIMIKGKCQGSVREFHNVWKVGTLILTFAHIVVAIPVFSMTNINQISLKFVSFKRPRY